MEKFNVWVFKALFSDALTTALQNEQNVKEVVLVPTTMPRDFSFYSSKYKEEADQKFYDKCTNEVTRLTVTETNGARKVYYVSYRNKKAPKRFEFTVPSSVEILTVKNNTCNTIVKEHYSDLGIDIEAGFVDKEDKKATVKAAVNQLVEKVVAKYNSGC